MDSTIEDIAKRRKPINKMAALVTGGGEHWKPDYINKNVFSVRPPLKRPVKNDKDYTGVSFGRLTVVGLNAYKGYANASKKRRNKAPAKWVCRCTCGYYCNRTAKRIKEADPSDMCRNCRELENLKSKIKQEEINSDEG